MKIPFRRPLRMIGYFAGVHAEYEDLVMLRDGELGAFETRCLESHLLHCPNCQSKLSTAERDLRVFRLMDISTDTADPVKAVRGLAKLRAAIRDWEAGRSREAEPSGLSPARRLAILRRLATECNLYLGERATAAFLVKLKSSHQQLENPLAEAESVLRDFLGPNAASAVTQRIVHLQTLMDARLPGPPPA